MGKEYSKFTLDKFVATWIISGAIYYSPRAFAPLLFSSAFNLAARHALNSMVHEGKWGITQKTANDTAKYFSIFSSISVEYFRPAFQTGLSDSLEPKYAAIGGKIMALALGNIASDLHKSLCLGVEKDGPREDIKESLPIIYGAARYFVFLSIREMGNQVFPKVYGYKPFGVLAASCIMYAYMAKSNAEGDYKENRKQYVCKKTLDYVFNQFQLNVLVKIPPFYTEKLLRYIVSDFGKKVFGDYVIKPFCKTAFSNDATRAV